MAQLSKTDAAYLAGLFDGEGHLGISLKPGRARKKDGGSPITVALVFMVINTYQPVIDWCVNVLGTGRKITMPKRGARTMPCYRYVLTELWALEVILPKLLPHLKIKKAQALAAMKFLQMRSRRTAHSPFVAAEISMLFDVRISNQRPYDRGRDTTQIAYKGEYYSREAFIELMLADRKESIYRSVSWTKRMESALGKDTDLAVSKKLGLKLAQVQRRRTALGISPVVK